MRFRYLFLLLSGLFLWHPVKAQRFILNMPEHDQKPYYFGITFGLNFSGYQIRYSKSFAETDTFKKIQPHFTPGFNLGLMANLRLNKRFDLRFVPSLAFAEKSLTYSYPGAADSGTIDKNIESIYMHLPLQLKFKSDRINNFRFYGMVGAKLDYDLAANARSRRADEFLKVKPLDAGYEIGFGFEFYNSNFIFSPEIKLSQGLMNQIYTDRSLPLTNAIDQIHTRMIVISIHLEG
ncbi:porin family protein [Chitinophagaceae bacterium MMS25-I14]